MISVLTSINEIATQCADRVAVSDDDRQLSYLDLECESDAVAQFLTNCGAKPGSVIGFMRESMIEAFVFAIACLKSGHAFLILDTREPLEKLRHIFTTAEVPLIITKGNGAKAVISRLPFQCVDYSEIDLSVPLSPKPSVSKDTLCWVEPTSGSTSLPKLVPVSQRVLEHDYTLQTVQCGLTSTDKIALFGEMWFDTLLTGLSVGAHLHVYNLQKSGAAPLPDWMRRNKISAMQTYPAAFRALCDATTGQLPDLKKVRLAGEALFEHDVREFERICCPGAKLMNYLGSTECRFIAQYTHQHGSDFPPGSLPAGKPDPNMVLQIVDETGTVCDTGVTGFIHLHAPQMAAEYLNNPGKTEGVYWRTSDGFFAHNTGDLGYVDRQGLLHVVGRADDRVKIRGYSVSLSEVEQAILSYGEVEELAVTSFVTPRGIRQLACHYVSSGQPLDIVELKQYLGSKVPAYFIPGYFLEHKSLPKTTSGKILRRKLPEPGLTEPKVDHSHFNELQKQIAAEWLRVLGHRDFGLEDDFFDVGGDSLQAMAMVVGLERILDIRIGYESLALDGGTIHQIEGRINAAQRGAKAASTIVLKDGPKGHPPVYILPVENGEFSDWLAILNAVSAKRRYIGVHAYDVGQRDNIPKLTVRSLGEFVASRIVEQDPNGPYFLAGYSAGTQIAVETARALTEAGKELAGVILLDPPVIPLEPYSKTWHIRRIFSPFFKKLAFRVTVSRMMHICFGRPIDDYRIAGERAFWSYQISPCPLPNTLVVSAEEENHFASEKERVWRDAWGEGIEIWKAPGNHMHLVRDPNAEGLARRLEDWIDENDP